LCFAGRHHECPDVGGGFAQKALAPTKSLTDLPDIITSSLATSNSSTVLPHTPARETEAQRIKDLEGTGTDGRRDYR
jgi:hypothetical protein